MIALYIILAAAALFALAVLTAPEGYEDETGFHYGAQPHAPAPRSDRRTGGAPSGARRPTSAAKGGAR